MVFNIDGYIFLIFLDIIVHIYPDKNLEILGIKIYIARNLKIMDLYIGLMVF
jgi:hypothetical protein